MTLQHEIAESKERSGYTRQEMQRFQLSEFRDLLEFVWENSPFYREYYSGHGLGEDDLVTVHPADIPTVSKQLLMEHFDDVVTDDRIHKAALDEWAAQIKDPAQRFENEYVLLHSAGSSGEIGTFVYDVSSWAKLRAMIVARATRIPKMPFTKDRLAYYGATHGQYAGVTLVADAPEHFYEVVLCSVLDPVERVVQQLNAFKPEQLLGYSTTINQLAGLALEGALKIQPKRIILSGDRMTKEHEGRIAQAWDAEIYQIYAASESVGIAVQRHDRAEFEVMDDLHVVEVLSDKDEEVRIGESGRIVMTNLYNRALPLIRYEMTDHAVRGFSPAENEAFSRLRKIEGRSNAPLPITLEDGRHDTVHPIVLSEFFVPGLKKIQFTSVSPREVEIRFVSDNDIRESIKGEFYRLLHEKGAVKSMAVHVHPVNELENDTKTGQHLLVVV